MIHFNPDEPQERMIAHLLKHPEALAFVGMGIGKSASCLAAFNALYCDMEVQAALVVAPMRVANLTWPMEVQFFQQFSWMRVASLRTREGRMAFIEGTAHIYTMNYEFMENFVELLKERVKWCKSHGEQPSLPYQVEIWDELTKAKNPSSKRIQLFRHSVPRARRKWGLTGTPAPNGLEDLFAQVRLIDGGKRLGDKVTFFKARFFDSNPYNFNKLEPKDGAEEKMYSAIADITISLRSKDWLNIPDPVVEDLEVRMPASVMRQYEELEEEAVLQLQEEKVISAANAGVLINKLLQFTSGAVYDEFRDVHVMHDLKIARLRELFSSIKKPLLVATMFKHEQDRIRRAFPEAKFFDDARTAAAQTELFMAWNKGKIPMLVCHPASAGHGLNLQHGGHHIVWMSLTYSREMYEQMIARLARRGQKEAVMVYRMMCPKTVDDVVAWALEEKASTERRLIDALMQLESWRKSS